MAVKDQVLVELEKHRGAFVSGEAISREIGISRQYISKVVKALIADGYDIEASTNKGYCLSENCDLLSAAVIGDAAGGKVYLFDSVDSTNRIARGIYSSEGECLVLSERQTAGVKKDGSPFVSPPSAGLYMTAALSLDIPLGSLGEYREGCALAVKQAIEAACACRAEIRNTDDIYVDGQKVCGILIECNVNAATLKTTCAYIGVGLYTGAADGIDAHICADEPRNNLAADIFKRLKNVR